MKTLFGALCCLFVFYGSLASAERLEDPYTIELPVASQSQPDRVAAMRNGLSLLLERLSGQRLQEGPQLKSAAARAESFVLQFSYVQDKPLAPTLPAAMRIRLGFSPALVNQLLADAGVALWPLDRPSVVMLMVNERGMFLPIAAAENVDVTAPLLARARMRGIPLSLPNPASQDISMAAAVQHLDVAALLPQLQQSKADALLIGNIRGDDAAGWNGQWILRFKDQDQPFQQKAATLDALVDEVLRQTAAYLSGLYMHVAVVDSGPAQLRLQIDGVKTYAAYMQLRQYLERIEAVQRLGSMQINGATVNVDVEVKGRESFRNLIALFKSLQWQEEILPPQGSDPSLKPVWRYQWVE